MTSAILATAGVEIGGRGEVPPARGGLGGGVPADPPSAWMADFEGTQQIQQLIVARRVLILTSGQLM